MTHLLIAVIAIAAIVLSVISARRALAERNVVERQQQALDLLGRMADRAVTDSPVVTTPGKYRPQHGKPPSPGSRIRTAAFAVGAAACVVALVVLVVASQRRGGRSHQALPNRPAATTTVPRPTTTAAPTTTTTAPPPLVLISDDSVQASYKIQGSAVEVDVVVSSAPCWVEITATATGGPVKFAGVLQPGSTETVTSGPASGATLQVADPAFVSLEVNGATMPLPQLSGGQPYTLHFEPALA